MKRSTKIWIKNSQTVLFAALKPIKAQLRHYIHSMQAGSHNFQSILPKTVSPFKSLDGLESDAPSSALEKLCDSLELGNFELQTLLLVAGAEISSSFRTLVGQAQGEKPPSAPTLDLAYKLFAGETEHKYFAMCDHAPLRDYELIRFKAGTDSRQFLPLEMDEKILNYLLGYSIIDRRLEPCISSIPIAVRLSFPKNIKSIGDISLGIERAVKTAELEETFPLIQLFGSSLDLKRQILATVLELLGYKLYELPWILLPENNSDLSRFYFLWMREAALDDCVLLLNCDSLGKNDTEQINSLQKFIAAMDAPVVISSNERLPVSGYYGVNFEVPPLTTPEQYQLWQMRLGENADSIAKKIETIVANFRLTPQEINNAVNSSIATSQTSEELYKNLWNTCRERARPKLDELAKRIEPSAGWSDLILPDDRKEMLGEMIATVRHRIKVFYQWNFGDKKNRGMGLCALFAGTSGTGKTMAAEVIAKELDLDLYRIDLSTVVSKYIGETEKNLKKLFDAAESGGVILLFDEGDALFGKRTEANDSKDKYANMEVSYLLQRIETYSGLAIITTNIEDSLDSAFMRRLRYVIKFPFPGATERASIWQKVYPSGVLKDPDSRIYEMLGQMEVSGGLIYSIALKSAFIAADDGADGVYRKHIFQAAKSEYTKIGRTLSISESFWYKP